MYKIEVVNFDKNTIIYNIIHNNLINNMDNIYESFSVFFKENNFNKTVNTLTFIDFEELFKQTNNSITGNNHLTPCFHYKSWFDKKIRKKVSRETKVNLEHKSETSKIALNDFMALKNVFTQPLENIFTKFTIDDYPKPIDTEKIEFLTSLQTKIEDKYVNYFHLYQKPHEYLYKIDFSKKLNEKHKDNILNEFINLCEDRIQKDIYFSMLQSRNEFYLLSKGCKNSYEITIRILKNTIVSPKKYNKFICNVAHVILLSYFWIKFCLSKQKFYQINELDKSFFISLMENSIKKYFRKNKNTLKFCNSLIKSINNTQNNQSHYCAEINNYYVTTTAEKYLYKQRKNSYIILHTNRKLSTREAPCLLAAFYKEIVIKILKSQNIPIPNKHINLYFCLIAYSPNILIISAPPIINDIIWDRFQAEPNFIFNFYESWLKLDSINRELAHVKI